MAKDLLFFVSHKCKLDEDILVVKGNHNHIHNLQFSFNTNKPSRVVLLSGNDNIVTGIKCIGKMISRFQGIMGKMEILAGRSVDVFYSHCNRRIPQYAQHGRI